ncbi:MAG: NF038122 family metalloprotease [Blastocatellia bacterium]|nr:NF038122 family metalloprotease [Blastocatellia bacterium]
MFAVMGAGKKASPSSQDRAPAERQRRDQDERQRDGRSRDVIGGRTAQNEFQEIGFVTYADGDKATCRDMTAAETAEMQRDLNPARRLRVISQAERQEAMGRAGLEARSEGPNGLTIILRSTAQLDSFPQAKTAFILAAAQWEAQIKNPITIVLDVDYGPTRFGQTYPSGVLGSTSTPTSTISYSQTRASLLASASSGAETSLYNALPSGASVTTDIGDVSNTSIVTPLQRAFGLLPADADPASNSGVPTIGFNSNFTFDFDPRDGITAGAIDFDAVAVHEMGHALGFTSNSGLYELQFFATRALTAWDLFRFRPGTTTETFTAANRILSSGGEHRFYDFQPELACSTGRPDASGGDGRQASHWKADELTGVYIGIMDPTLSSGQRKEMTANDLRLLETIGYRVSGTIQPACTYTLSPTNASYGTSGGTGSVTVTASESTCAWTATSNAAWITISSGASGTGNGSVNYSVEPNTGASRSGTITIAGQTFTVNQSGCSFTLSFATNSFPATASTGSVTVSASSTNCTWTAVSNASWLVITSGASGTGNGAVNYNVLANTGAARSGTMTIAGQTFTVNQAAGTPTCGFTLSPTSANPGTSGGLAILTVTASASNCAWTATSNVNWVSILFGSSGTGNGSIYYNVSTNNGAARTGTLTVGGQTFTINQAGTGPACTYNLSASSANVAATANTGSVGVIASATNCSWTAVSNVNWVQITGGASGTGNGTVSYSVQANSGAARSGTLTIAGRTYTINQAAAPVACTFGLSASSANVVATANTGSVNVNASASNCSWTAASNANWIQITNGASGTGNGTVSYSVQANSGAARSGTLTIAGLTYTINQAAGSGGGGTCAFNVSATSLTVGSLSSTVPLTVTASAVDCAWTAASNAAWITIASGASGTGNGVVTLNIQANSTGQQRTGTLQIAGQTVTITQQTVNACSLTIAPLSRTVAATASSQSVTVTVGSTFCFWGVSSTVNWLTVTSSTFGFGNGTVTYSVGANTGAARTGTIIINGQTHVVTQSAGTTNLTLPLSAFSISVPTSENSGTLDVNMVDDAWEAVSNVSWVTILSRQSSREGSMVEYVVAPNLTGVPRTGTLTIAGQTFTITQ